MGRVGRVAVPAPDARSPGSIPRRRSRRIELVPGDRLPRPGTGGPRRARYHPRDGRPRVTHRRRRSGLPCSSPSKTIEMRGPLLPHHRAHRRYAEPRPAPRALAHQDRDTACSLNFPYSVPTFQDWARREAAAARPGSAAPGVRPGARSWRARRRAASVAAARSRGAPRSGRSAAPGAATWAARHWAAPPPWQPNGAPGGGPRRRAPTLQQPRRVRRVRRGLGRGARCGGSAGGTRARGKRGRSARSRPVTVDDGRPTTARSMMTARRRRARRT